MVFSDVHCCWSFGFPKKYMKIYDNLFSTKLTNTLLSKINIIKQTKKVINNKLNNKNVHVFLRNYYMGMF